MECETDVPSTGLRVALSLKEPGRCWEVTERQDGIGLKRKRLIAGQPPDSSKIGVRGLRTPVDPPPVERARKECAMPPEKQEQIAKERAIAHDRETHREPAPRRTTTGR